MKFYVHVFLLPFMLKQRKKPHTNHHYIKPFGHYHYTKQQIISSWSSRVGNSFINDSMWHLYHSHLCHFTEISYISKHFNTMPPKNNVTYFKTTFCINSHPKWMYFGSAEKKWIKIRTHKWKRKLSTEVRCFGDVLQL